MTASTKHQRRGAPIDHVTAIDEDADGFTLHMDDGSTTHVPMRATNARTQTWLRALRAHRSQQAQQKQSTTEEEPQQFAAGGVVPDNVSAQPSKSPKRPRGAPIDHVTAIDEDADGFTLHMDDGSTTRVPMRATNARTQTWLRALRAHKARKVAAEEHDEPQQFAAGGMVPASLPFTPAIPPPEQLMSVEQEPVTSPMEAPAPSLAAAGASPNDVLSRALDWERFSREVSRTPAPAADLPKHHWSNQYPDLAGKSLDEILEQASKRKTEQAAFRPSVSDMLLASAPRSAADQQRLHDGISTLSTPTTDPSPASAVPVPIEPTPQNPLPAPVASRMSVPSAGMPSPVAGDQQSQQPGSVQTLQDALRAQREAAMKTSSIASRQEAARAQLLADRQVQERKLQEEIERSRKARSERYTEIRNRYAKGEIDPRRFWSNQSIPAKISTAIGLFLGGLGSGMTRSPNHALQLFEKFIDDDIAAQREALQRDGRLLDILRQEGLDEEAVLASRKLDLMAAFSGELERQAAQYNSEKILEGAQFLDAQLQAQAIPLIQQVSEAEANAAFQAQWRPVQLESARLQQQEARQRMELQKQQAVQATEAETQRALIMDHLVGDGLPGHAAFALEMLPKDVRERAVQIDGRWFLALDKDAKQRITQTETDLATAKGMVEELRSIRQRHPTGWGVLRRGADRKDLARVEQIATLLPRVIGKAIEGSRLSNEDAAAYREAVPDLSKWTPGGAYADSQIEGLGRLLNDMVRAARNANLARPAVATIASLDAQDERDTFYARKGTR